MVAYDILAQGQVSTSAVIYTAPATGAIIKHIKFINTTAGGATIKVWLNGNGDPQIWHPQVTLAQSESIEFNGTLSLGSGDTIQAVGGAAINFLISGAIP